jgi:predicted TPR repeat methyltransferase
VARRHEQARRLLAHGHVDRGIAVLTQLVAELPRSAQLRRHLALALQRSGRSEEALQTLLDASRAIPDDVRLLDDAAVVARQIGRHDTVVAMRRRSIEIDPSPYRWQLLATACRRAGDTAGEGEAMVGWAAADPDDPVAVHLAAARNGETIERASAAYVAKLFDGYAAHFDDHLAGLGYRAPTIVAEHLERALAGGRAAVAADLGCGTGVLGPLVRDLVDQLIGIDLSEGMLERAVERGYDELIRSDLVEFLSTRPASFEALLSADTLNYLGDLESVFVAARAALRSGVFVFTLEHDTGAISTARPDSGYRLCHSGRFVHDESYVIDTLREAGFTEIRVDHEILRQEGRDPVHGLVVTAC